MTLSLYLAFVAATAALIALPGPNVALIVGNSVAFGTRFGLITVLATNLALALQLAMVVLGMTAILKAASDWFEVLRWAGVAYLVGLGILHWRKRPTADDALTPRATRTVLARGLLISLTNPKTLLFFGAFFPQFLSPGEDLWRQILLLAGTFLVIALVMDAGWALLAGRLRHVLAMRPLLRERLTGSLMIGAGIGLALARR